MVRPRYIVLIFVAVAITASILLSSCEKCYFCYIPGIDFTCYKGTDTLYFSSLSNTPSYYISRGYTCDTTGHFWYWNNYTNAAYPSCTYGPIHRKKAESAGDSCGINE
jgi:hypothetical protein